MYTILWFSVAAGVCARMEILIAKQGILGAANVGTQIDCVKKWWRVFDQDPLFHTFSTSDSTLLASCPRSQFLLANGGGNSNAGESMGIKGVGSWWPRSAGHMNSRLSSVNSFFSFWFMWYWMETKKMGVSIAMGVSKNGWFIRKTRIKMDDLGVPLF